MKFRIHIGFHDHKKTRGIDAAAIGLWTLAGSWCVEQQTGGFVPEVVVPRWSRRWRKLASTLVDHDLWKPAEDDGVRGWQFVHWSEWQGPLVPVVPFQTAPIGVALRRQILERDAHRCQSCGARERLEIDHIHPRSKGGSNDPSNLQVLCATCNRRKGDR